MPTNANQCQPMQPMQPTTTITTQVPGYYKCGHCALHFKTRARFQSHEATCLSLKQIRARATFAPDDHITTAELFAVVQQLAVRLETAEQELSVLRRQQQTQTQTQTQPQLHRGNLLQWLNEVTEKNEVNEKNEKNEVTETNEKNGTNETTFSEWLPAIPALRREHLELVFQHGFMDGMCAIIALFTAEGCAICAYDEAPGTLFVYEGEAGGRRAWRLMAHGEFERFINRMQKLLMNEFVRWQQEHRERWHEPDFAEQYDANLLKVTGSGKAKSGGCSNRDMLMTRLKPKVYAAIKRPARQ